MLFPPPVPSAPHLCRVFSLHLGLVWAQTTVLSQPILIYPLDLHPRPTLSPSLFYCSPQQPPPPAAAGPTPEPGRPPPAPPPGASPGCATRPPAPCGSPAAPASRAGTCPPRGSWLVEFPGRMLESPARALRTQLPRQLLRTTQIS